MTLIIFLLRKFQYQCVIVSYMLKSSDIQRQILQSLLRHLKAEWLRSLM